MSTATFPAWKKDNTPGKLYTLIMAESMWGVSAGSRHETGRFFIILL